MGRDAKAGSFVVRAFVASLFCLRRASFSFAVLATLGMVTVGLFFLLSFVACIASVSVDGSSLSQTSPIYLTRISDPDSHLRVPAFLARPP